MNIKNLPVEVQYQIGMGFIKDDSRDAVSFKNKFQQKLNYLKQQKLIEKSNAIFGIFDNGKGDQKGIKFLMEQKPSANFFCNMSLKDLGIDKRQVIAACCVK